MAILATGILYILFLLGLCDYLYMSSAGLHSLRTFFRWLKGSRKTYYLGTRDISPLRSTDFTPEELARIADPGVLAEPVIEISRGLFRRRSAVYGKAQWQIQKDWHEFGLDPVGADRVSLTDTRGLLVETALQLINTYSSLQAMLDRIAELESRPTRLELQNAEDNLFLANERQQELAAAIIALREQILSDRQRYRGVVPQELRHDLQLILNEVNISVSATDSRLKTWSERFYKVRLLKEQQRAAIRYCSVRQGLS